MHLLESGAYDTLRYGVGEARLPRPGSAGEVSLGVCKLATSDAPEFGNLVELGRHDIRRRRKRRRTMGGVPASSASLTLQVGQRSKVGLQHLARTVALVRGLGRLIAGRALSGSSLGGTGGCQSAMEGSGVLSLKLWIYFVSAISRFSKTSSLSSMRIAR